jgi:hypothetical protein
MIGKEKRIWFKDWRWLFGGLDEVRSGFGKDLVLGNVARAGRGKFVGIDEESTVQVTGV